MRDSTLKTACIRRSANESLPDLSDLSGLSLIICRVTWCIEMAKSIERFHSIVDDILLKSFILEILNLKYELIGLK
jgi:hypothetical protein